MFSLSSPLSLLNVKEIVSENPILGSKFKKDNSDVVDNFSVLLKKALLKVNDLQLNSDTMINKMIVDPGKVNIHEITNSISQAEMAISMTKAVSDRIINAYRDLTNLR